MVRPWISFLGELSFLTVLLTAAVCAFAQTSSAAAKPLDRNNPLPYKTHWGPYTVTVVSLSPLSERLRILDPQGVTLREIRATDIDTVDFPRLRSHGPADLRVFAQPLVNIIHCRRTYVFSRGGGLHNVLIMPEGFDDVRDLGLNGQRELIADIVAPLEYVADVCHGCSPSLMLVLGWNGRQYVVQNRRYPWLARRKAREYRRKFLLASSVPDAPEDQKIAPAIGYWANMKTIGQERVAMHWLMKRMGRSLRLWFLTSLPDVRARLARIPSQITISQQRVYIVPEAWI